MKATLFRSAGRPARWRRRRQGQLGLTLIELMVSVTVGMLIVLALTTLWTNTSRNTSDMARTNRLVENGRFALQVLRDDVVHGGFWGGFLPQFEDLSYTSTPVDAPTAIPDPCKAVADWTAEDKMNLVGLPVQTYAIGSTVPSPTVPVCSGVVTNPKTNSDVLMLRHAEACLPGQGDCAADAAGSSHDKLYFQASMCSSEIAAGNTFVFGTSTAALNLHKRGTDPSNPATCGASNEYRRYQSTIYYVRNYSTAEGDGIPTLVRSRFETVGGVPAHASGEALIEGIEALRVELGLDGVSDSGGAVDNTAAIVWADPNNLKSPTNRGDGYPDGAFVHCSAAGTSPCTAAALANVVSLRIYLLVRAETASASYTDAKTYQLGGTTVGPFNDRYRRHVFSTTVRLVNVSGRRETPP